MKAIKAIIATAVVICVAGSNAAGWGRLGHMAIAEVAQRHLTPRAAENINKYTGGEPLASFALYLDESRNTPYLKARYAGWHACIATPDCTSPYSVREEKRKSKDGVTAMEMFREKLVGKYQDLPDSVVLESIKCITHIIGDFHCPQHVRYTDNNNEGKFDVTFCGQTTLYHALWDSGLIMHVSGYKGKDYAKYATELDTWTEEEIKAVTQGWAQEWFEDAARDVRPIVGTVGAGAELGESWARAHYPLAVQQMQKAAYQLAAALNTIFG